MAKECSRHDSSTAAQIHVTWSFHCCGIEFTPLIHCSDWRSAVPLSGCCHYLSWPFCSDSWRTLYDDRICILNWTIMAHRTKRMSHEECRRVVCILCMNKAKEIRQITSRIHDLIKEYIFTGNELNDDRLSTATCSTCRLKLEQYAKQNFGSNIEVFDYSSLSRTYATRTYEPDYCSCTVCEVARSNSVNNFGLKKSRVGRPSTSTDQRPVKPTPIVLCPLCLGYIGRRISSRCGKADIYMTIYLP